MGAMMTRWGLWLLLGAGAATLGACATTTTPMAIKPDAVTTTPLPPNMVWIYRDGLAGKAHLSFGLPDSDVVGLMFDCGRRAAIVGLHTDLANGRPGPGEVRLRSGKAEGRYAARIERSELTGGWDAQGQIPLADPVLASFEQTGLISQVEDQAYAQNARSTAERANIKRFFGVCRGG